jgi:hypothetical protein
VEKNATPGSTKEKTFENPDKNGGALGADNPTYHASIGWDWIPTIRGRNTGIWGDVYLEITGPVILENPLITTHVPLPDMSHANVSVDVDVVNYENKTVIGTLRGRFRATSDTRRLREEDHPPESGQPSGVAHRSTEVLVARRLRRAELVRREIGI